MKNLLLTTAAISILAGTSAFAESDTSKTTKAGSYFIKADVGLTKSNYFNPLKKNSKELLNVKLKVKQPIYNGIKGDIEKYMNLHTISTGIKFNF